jgi:hypothetical protein
MNSHAHVILELPAPKEVSMIWDLNLPASFNSQAFARCTRNRERQSATNTPSYRCCPGYLFSSSASCATLPVHCSSPVLNPVALKVQIPMLKTAPRWQPTDPALANSYTGRRSYCKCSSAAHRRLPASTKIEAGPNSRAWLYGRG